MNIKVNGKTQHYDAPLTVASLVEQLKLNPRQAAIERNLEIVPRSQYGEQMLSDGDQIEIVSFIGGG